MSRPLVIPSSRSRGIISFTASKIPLCLASWPSNSLAQALQQPQTEQPDSPDPQPQILVVFNYLAAKDTIIYQKKVYNNMDNYVVDSLFLPPWNSVRTSTTDTACTIACTITTHCTDHALIQFPFMQPWLAHHAFFFLLL